MFLTSWYVEGTNAKGASRMDYVRNGLFQLVEEVYADEERVGILDGGNPKVTGVNMADAAFRAEYGKTGSPNDTNHLGAKGMKLMAEGMLPLIWDAMKEHVEEKGYTRVVCVGDSITRNGYWKNNLYGYLESDKYEVMGYGVNGATGYSKGIDQGSPKAYIDQPEYQQSLQYLPDVVVIMLGTNDTKPENYSPICADGGKQYIADIVALIRSYQSLPSAPKVYVALPATIFKDTAPIRNFPLEENLIAFLMEAAKQTGADVIDVHEATKDAGAHFSDKVHPSDDEGRKIIAQTVADAILEDE
jgi:lysophospholipase L1-like esterase